MHFATVLPPVNGEVDIESGHFLELFISFKYAAPCLRPLMQYINITLEYTIAT